MNPSDASVNSVELYKYLSSKNVNLFKLHILFLLDNCTLYDMDDSDLATALDIMLDTINMGPLKTELAAEYLVTNFTHMLAQVNPADHLYHLYNDETRP